MTQTAAIFKNPDRLLWLIVACLLLLGLSQVLWLGRVWDNQKQNLHQVTNYIFQTTVLSLQDSLISRSMGQKGFPMNGALSKAPAAFFGRPVLPGYEPELRSKARFRVSQTINEDLVGTPLWEDRQHIKLILSSTDSQEIAMRHGLGRIFLNIKVDSLPDGQNDFTFDIKTDTIAPEELIQSFTAALGKAGLPTSFELLSGRSPAEFINQIAGITTKPVVSGILTHRFYAAKFNNYHGFLIRKTLIYGLFSLFLISITSLAFWLIFNTLKQQQKIARQKNEFVSNVTHELKTPLTTVGVALEALDDFEVLQNPEKAKEYLHISKLELNRLNLLVDKVLRVSMFEHQALQLKPEMLNLVDTARQVIHAMTLQAKSAGAAIHFKANSSPCMVCCDQLHLNGVVYNLLDNALKYRRETPEIEVSIGNTLREGIAFFSLSVRDNGIGISAEHQSQIFEKFFRVPAGDTHNVKGHGLGLSYVAHVVREHGGSIRVESVPGTGSCFIVEIPAATPPPTA